MKAISRRRSVGAVSRLALACSAVAMLSPVCAHAADAASTESGDAQPVAAQVASGPATAAPVQGAGGIADILVTARKTTERAVKVPISLVSVDNKTLVQRNIVNLQDFAVSVPGVRISDGFAGGIRSIRGGGAPGSNVSIEQSTGLFFDNVSYGKNLHQFLPFFDVQQVDVLRGPQVIAFGNSTTSGAFAVTSRLPGDEIAADLSAQYEFENHETVLRGGVDLPLADGIKLRISGFGQFLDRGWVDNITPERGSFWGPTNHTWAVRGILMTDLSDSVRAKIKFEHDDIHIRGQNNQEVYNPDNIPTIVESDFDNRTYVNAGAFIRMRNNSVLLEVVKDFGGFDITSTTAYTNFNYSQNLDTDGTPQLATNTKLLDKYGQFSQELRVSSAVSSTLRVNGGIFYQNEREDPSYLLSRFVPPGPFGRLSTLRTRADQVSAYGEFGWTFLPHLTLDGALRYVHVGRTGDQAITSTVPGTFDPTALNPLVPSHAFYNIRTPFDYWEPQVVLSYEVGRNVNLYAKYVKGDKSGGVDYMFAGTDPERGKFGAEKATSYEIGLKGYFFNHTMSLNLAAFRSDYKDLQVGTYSSISQSFELKAAGGARSQGVELETIWAPRGGLRVNAAVSFLDARFRSFPGASCTPEQAVGRPVPCTIDLSGVRTPLNSKWTVSAGIQYAINLGDWDLTPRADLNYRSSYYASTNSDPLFLYPGFATVDARLELARRESTWSFSMFAKDINNKRWTEFVTQVGYYGRARFADTQRGRQIGIAVATKF